MPGIKTVESARDVLGYYQMTGIASATQLPGSGSVVMLQAEAQGVRYDPTGGTPTASVGILLSAGETHTLNVGDGNVPKIKVIQAAPGAILNVVTFR